DLIIPYFSKITQSELTDFNEMNSQLKNAVKDVEILQNLNQTHSSIIQDLQSELKQKDTTIQDLQSELKQKDTTIQDLQSELKQKDTTIQDLRKEHDDLRI